MANNDVANEEGKQMNKFGSRFKDRTCLIAAVLAVFMAGCGQDGIFGGGGGGGGGNGALAPTVTAVAPLNNATGVAINTKIITAAFSKAMNPATLTPASFTLACPAGTPVAGAVTYIAASSVATLTLPAAPNLPPSTVCIADRKSVV